MTEEGIRAMAAAGRGGVIDALVAGDWAGADGRRARIPIEAIVIADTLEGREAELVRARHADARLCVVHDPFTREALGGRVLAALRSNGMAVEEYVWERPRVTPEDVAGLMEATQGAEALIAVGSGTVSDGAKYATHLDGRAYSVFATSPMNAYTTPTASVSFGGLKRSLTCHSARGVFFDLGVIARCPRRLVSAAFADVICRTTAQVDWLASHLLLGTPYSETAYELLAIDEDGMIAAAPRLMEGDFEALARLTRVSAIMGLGTSFTGTTHVGSMAEHMISHCIDMFAADAHPGTSHGEQVGVAALTISQLQNAIWDAGAPPELAPTEIPAARLHPVYGAEAAASMIEQTEAKALDGAAAARLNDRLARDWGALCARIRPVMRPAEELEAAMRAAGCQTSAAELGLEPALYRRLVRDARFIRDRWTALDMAGDSGLLDPFAETLC